MSPRPGIAVFVNLDVEFDEHEHRRVFCATAIPFVYDGTELKLVSGRFLLWPPTGPAVEIPFVLERPLVMRTSPERDGA